MLIIVSQTIKKQSEMLFVRGRSWPSRFFFIQTFGRDSPVRRRFCSAHLTTGGQLKPQILTGAPNLMTAQLRKGLKYGDSESNFPGENRVHADVCPTRPAVPWRRGVWVKPKISLMTVFSQLHLDSGPHEILFEWLKSSASQFH